jgi:hypothetical protein
VEGSVVANGTGISINGSGIEVTIRNLSIYGASPATFGIRVINAARVTIENVIIERFADGINSTAVAQVMVKNTLVADSTGFGVYVRNGRATLDNVQLVDNALDGLRIGIGGTGSIRNSTVTGSGNLGLSAAESASAKLTIDNCQINANNWGVGAAGGGTVWMSNSVISNSTTQALYFAASSSLISYGSNRLTNNPADGAFSATISPQ